MSLLARLEQRIGFISVEHLPIYIVSAQSLLYLWCLVNPMQAHLLLLDPLAVQAGEYWRLLTFLFMTPLQNALFAFFFLYLLYVYGSALESAWGSFAFTLFYLIGSLATLSAGYFVGGYDGAFYLNTTLFLAFAALHPDFELYFFFILPVKIKWLAALTWAYLIYDIWVSPIYTKMAIIVSLSNYILFFGKAHVVHVKDWISWIQHRQRYRNFNDQ